MITAMISFKILSVSRMLKKSTTTHSVMEPAHARTYTNIVVILVESAAPCAILGIITCVGWFTSTEPGFGITSQSTFGLSNDAISSTWAMCLVSFFFFNDERQSD
jgi:hypothetical protein